jgi:hypothetical protein
MSGVLTGTTAALALALGIALSAAPSANAQSVAGPERVETTQGGYIMTRARGGRVGVYRGGGGRYYGGYRGNRGRYIAGGLAAGIAGAIILNQYAGPGYYYRTGPYLSCGELEYRCDRGEGWACRRLDVDPRC